jgi:hypothetical protein
MSGLPFPDDEDEAPAAAEFRAAILECRRNGWKPLAIVVPTLGRRSPKIAALSLEFDLPVYEDPRRDPEQGIGLRYEAETLDPNALSEGPFTEPTGEPIDELLDDGKDGEAWRK